MLLIHVAGNRIPAEETRDGRITEADKEAQM